MKRRKQSNGRKEHKPISVLEPTVKPACKARQGQGCSKTAPAPAAQKERTIPYSREEYGALMHGYHVGDPVTAARLKQPQQSSQDWNPPHPTAGMITYIHPDGIFAVVRFDGNGGAYQEAFYAYDLAHRTI